MPSSEPIHEPCSGSPLLSCCDDIATQSKPIEMRVSAYEGLWLDVAVAARGDAQLPPRLVPPRDSARLGWLASALRRSTVLRL
jgi:hypothetical protein